MAGLALLRGGIDLLRIFARFERRRIAVGELVDGEVEGAALAVLIAVDRAGDAFVALGREQLVAQCLSADIEGALVVGLANLLDRLGEDRGGVIGLGMEGVDRTFAVL